MDTKIEVINVDNKDLRVIEKDVIFSLNRKNVLVFQITNINRNDNVQFF